MSSNALSSQYRSFSDLLANHKSRNEKDGGLPLTHTRIGNRELNIYAGSYSIPPELMNTFYALYYDNVFVKDRSEYLTEVQLKTGHGPIVVDFDFRYDPEVDVRKHTTTHLEEMVMLYLEELRGMFDFEPNQVFDIFLFEKPNVNRQSDVTKDGIHMLIGIQADHVTQCILRERILPKLESIWSDLPLTNTWNDVLDEGISKGVTNWQLYGSKKPGNESYQLTQHYTCHYDDSILDFAIDEKNVVDFELKKNFYRLSVQNASNPRFEMQADFADVHKQRTATQSSRKPTRARINRLPTASRADGGGAANPEEEGVMDLAHDDEHISIFDIKDVDLLDRALHQLFKQLKATEYEIKETHEYTMLLPAKYYEPGSHLLNRQVAFALKHTDNRLFLSWIKLRSKASDFDFETIPTLFNQWNRHFNVSREGVTRRSIMFWAKQECPQGFEEVKKRSIHFFIEESIRSKTEYDKAMVLKQLYKDKYVCSSVRRKIWYVFKDHRWVLDEGVSLRLIISQEMFMLYSQYRSSVHEEMLHIQQKESEQFKTAQNKLKILGDILISLKRTADKNNVMNEAAEIFWDKDFANVVDTNKHLMCFNNGVVDFKKKCFRDGYPEDYITKSTNIDFIPMDNPTPELQQSAEEINSFMKKLFPDPGLYQYMWDHLASTLIGTNKNQTFNVYHGSGSNGKSILTDLMSVTLGEYKGTVPITLVTEKRGLIGGTSDEVLKLKGVRYAVMQEPSKGVKLNEGIMKELTGGDPIQARGLYSESETFEPQFSLVVCTNNLFDIESNDDGTWRRIRKVEFESKFVDPNEMHTDPTPFTFAKDKDLKEKFPTFAPIFAGMLVKRAFETDGIVVDCKKVIDASRKYRENQDVVTSFISEMIEEKESQSITKTSVSSKFKMWFETRGGRNKPKGQEVWDALIRRYPDRYTQLERGKMGWKGLVFKEDNPDNHVDEDKHEQTLS